MDNPYLATRSHLFTIRMWHEKLADDRLEWRGQVQHVASGKARYFRDWPTLVTFLQETLNNLPDERPAS
jgi:hypothetical protein